MNAVPLSTLTIAQISMSAVWHYVPSKDGRVWVTAESKRRLNLKNRVIAVEAKMANGKEIWMLLENVHVDNPVFTQHWLQATFRINGRWWVLARYHDFDSEKRSPLALAKLLKMELLDVFPLSYDIRHLCKSPSQVLLGTIVAEPITRLSRREIILLTVPKP